MPANVKRTYNLSPETIRRVRELASEYGAASSQDAVVELAIERLYGEVRDRLEAEEWDRAGTDPAFRAEMAAIAVDLDNGAPWPR
jgi:hypothetical protein